MSMMTQRQLADLAGLSQSAVSLALRGHPRIPADTAHRVEMLARRHGYRRDAIVAGLSLRRWSKPVGPLAYLGSHIQGGDPTRDRYWKAIQLRCRDHALTVQMVPPQRRRDPRLGAQLARCGVRGLIVGQDTSVDQPWRLDWAQFAVVHCGLYMAPEDGDVVAADLFTAVGDAWRALQAHGYRRVAALMPIRDRSLSEHMLAASLLTITRTIGDERRLASWIGATDDERGMLAWLRCRQPQAVLGYGDGMREVLLRAGVDLPYAALACGEHRPSASGIVVPFSAIGARAVDLLVEKLRHGVVGCEIGRSIHLVKMPWRDGDSLPDCVDGNTAASVQSDKSAE